MESYQVWEFQYKKVRVFQKWYADCSLAINKTKSKYIFISRGKRFWPKFQVNVKRIARRTWVTYLGVVFDRKQGHDSERTSNWNPLFNEWRVSEQKVRVYQKLQNYFTALITTFSKILKKYHDFPQHSGVFDFQVINYQWFFKISYFSFLQLPLSAVGIKITANYHLILIRNSWLLHFTSNAKSNTC